MFDPDPEFDEYMVQAWNTYTDDPQLFNNVSQYILTSYLVARSIWRKFTGRIPRRRRLMQRKKFNNDPSLRDARKPRPKIYMWGM